MACGADWAQLLRYGAPTPGEAVRRTGHRIYGYGAPRRRCLGRAPRCGWQRRRVRRCRAPARGGRRTPCRRPGAGNGIKRRRPQPQLDRKLSARSSARAHHRHRMITRRPRAEHGRRRAKERHRFGGATPRVRRLHEDVVQASANWKGQTPAPGVEAGLVEGEAGPGRQRQWQRLRTAGPAARGGSGVMEGGERGRPDGCQTQCLRGHGIRGTPCWAFPTAFQASAGGPGSSRSGLSLPVDRAGRRHALLNLTSGDRYEARCRRDEVRMCGARIQAWS